MGRGIARTYSKSCTCTDDNKKDNWEIILTDYPNNQPSKGIRFYCGCVKCKEQWYTRSKYVMWLNNTHKFKNEIEEMLEKEVEDLDMCICKNEDEIKRLRRETDRLLKKRSGLYKQFNDYRMEVI